MLSLKIQTNIGDGTWGTCYCQTNWDGDSAECLIEDGGGVLWDVSSNFLVENIYANNWETNDDQIDFTYANELFTEGSVEYYWNNDDEYARILVLGEATYNWRHKLLYSDIDNSFDISLETLIPDIGELLYIKPDTKFRFTGKIRGCQKDVNSGECLDRQVTSTELFGLRGFQNHSFRGESSDREITIGGTDGLDDWVEVNYEFQVGKYVPCVCTGDWNNINDLHNEENCSVLIINSDVCNEEVYCRDDDTCNNHDNTTCTSDTEYGVSNDGGCIIAPYLTFPEVGNLSNTNSTLHTLTTFLIADEYDYGNNMNEIHVKDLELKYVPNDVDAMSCDDFGGFWTGIFNGGLSNWQSYQSNCSDSESGFQCAESGNTGIWDTLRDIDDSVYVWGAQLEIGDTMSPYTTEDIDFSDCLEVDSATPSNDRYWKNIASTFDNILEGTYYYPVLPAFDQKGEFIQTELQNGKIPFGGIQYDGTMWNPSDSRAPITNDVVDNSLKIEIKTEDVENNVLMDNSGNKNFGFTINDYNINFDLETREASKKRGTTRFKKSKKGGAY